MKERKLKMKRMTIVAEKAPAAVGPYSHGIKAGDILYTSGQLGLEPETGKLKEGIEAQTMQALNNLKEIIEEAGMSLEHIVKTTVFLDNMSDFTTINKIYADFFDGLAPARSCVEVAALPMGALFEIEAIAIQ